MLGVGDGRQTTRGSKNEVAGRRACLQGDWTVTVVGLAAGRLGSGAARGRAAVSPAARRAWRRRGRTAQAGAPASARTPSPQIRRPGSSIRSPSRGRATGPGNEATPRATPITQPPKRATAARHRHRDEVVTRAAPARGPHGSGGLSARALHSGSGSLSAAAQTGDFVVELKFLPDSRAS